MEKKCLIFMPSGDPFGYSAGHFKRIYDYIIVPACRLAEVSPEKLEHQVTLKEVIDADVVLTDLSSSNPEVLYGFATRQALHLPVAAIKDTKTSLDYVFNEFTIAEYDESLRIDIVQNAIESVSNALKMALFSGREGSLLAKLNIGSSQGYYSPPSSTFVNSFTAEEPVKIEEPAAPLPDYVGDPISESDIEKLKAGDTLYHTTYGKGVIVSIKVMAKEKMANVQFDSGKKLLILGPYGYFRNIIE